MSLGKGLLEDWYGHANGCYREQALFAWSLALPVCMARLYNYIAQSRGMMIQAEASCARLSVLLAS